eukprot:SAG31_NODE_3366_length_4358_cov_2.048133_5_plen_199_part_00
MIARVVTRLIATASLILSKLSMSSTSARDRHRGGHIAREARPINRHQQRSTRSTCRLTVPLDLLVARLSVVTVMVAVPHLGRACNMGVQWQPEDPMKPGGVIPGTCEPGTAGCKQGPQCQARADNVYMPTFHILGNFTRGSGGQPEPINDVSSVIFYKGVWHIFHQFGQCAWAHVVSRDLAHWKNLRYPITPDRNVCL